MKLFKNSLLITLAAAGSANAAVTAIDFGTSQAFNGSIPNVLFTGTFDGTTGFIEGSVPFSLESNTFSIPLGGGATIEFSSVAGWGNDEENDGSGMIGALSASYLYSGGENGAAGEVDSPFTITGLAATDIVRLEMIGGPARTGILNFNGSGDVTLPADAAPTAFTQVGTDATGATSYSGSLRGGAGFGEQNFSAARITITSIPEPSSGLTLLGLIGLAMTARHRR